MNSKIKEYFRFRRPTLCYDIEKRRKPELFRLNKSFYGGKYE